MTTRRRASVLVATAVALVLAAALALLAVDVRRWDSAMAADDVHFQATPQAVDWKATEMLPGEVAPSLLAIEDDIAFRRAARTFQLGRRVASSIGAQQAREGFRVRAEIELGTVERADPDAGRRAIAANLLGILAFDHALGDPRNGPALFRRSVADFRRAMAHDPTNEDAKYNLELVLRLLQADDGERRENVEEFSGGQSRGAGVGGPGRGY